jgi:hypothetical protein
MHAVWAQLSYTPPQMRLLDRNNIVKIDCTEALHSVIDIKHNFGRDVAH